MHSWLLENKAIALGNEMFLQGVMMNNLKNFAAKNDLQRAVLTYISFKFEIEEVKEVLHTAFDVVDLNDDGEISRDEIYKAFIAMGKSEELAREIAERILANVDLNKDGFISFTEFLAANLNDMEVHNKERLKACFDAIDANGDGFLNLQEMQAFLFPGKKSWNLQEQKRAETVLLKAQDTNNDGKICFHEFMALMQEYTNLYEEEEEGGEELKEEAQGHS